MALALHPDGFHFHDLEHWAAERLHEGAAQVAATLTLWQQRVQERRELASLDDHMLADIGISRADVWREVHKPFWRA